MTTFAEIICETTADLMKKDSSVTLFGLGVTSPAGVFGTTRGLVDMFGNDRVVEIPASELGATNWCLGSALMGARPILVHQRADFALLSLDAIVNQIAKWPFMFGYNKGFPVTIRIIVGRGWGQGPQHSQSFANIFTSVPGLQVFAPCFPADAGVMLRAAVEGDTPTIFLEHRWLHDLHANPPNEPYAISEEVGPLRTHLVRQGDAVTIVSYSYMTVECLRAAELLSALGIGCAVLDLRNLSDVDWDPILTSVERTGHLVVVDQGHLTNSIASEVCANAVTRAWGKLLKPPLRVALPDYPTPTSTFLCKSYYPDAHSISNDILGLLDDPRRLTDSRHHNELDVPSQSFIGPY